MTKPFLSYDSYESMISAIDRCIDRATARIAEDTIRLINVKSVESKPLPGAPFGNGVKIARTDIPS